MALYTDESVERVRDAIDMVDLVGSKTELRRAGANRYEGLCPFHDERTPSFGIDPIKKLYHCFGCGEGGDAIKFLRETEGVDFKGALERLADRYGVELELAEEDPHAAETRRRRERLMALLDRTAAFYERYLWESAEAARAREYLLGRGLTEEALRRFRVGFAPSAWDKVLMASRRAEFSERELLDAGLASKSHKGEGRIYDRFRARIMFPLADSRGRVVGFGARIFAQSDDPRGPKYLNTSENDLFHKGRQVYGAHLARPAAAKRGFVVVVEGYTDVIALHQSGFDNAVAVMGTSLTEDQVRELGRMAPVAQLALDADNAGQEAMLRAARVATGSKLELRVVPLPAGSDPADLIAEQGADAFGALVEKSMPFVRFRVVRALQNGDLSSAEGKDKVLDELRPAFGAIPPSILREELVRLVADRLDLSEALAGSLLAQAPRPVPAGEGRAGGGRGGYDRGGGRGGHDRGQPSGGEPHGGDPFAHGPHPEGPYGGDPGPMPGAAPRRPPAAAPPARLTATEEVERTFLAQCLALGATGRDELSRVSPEAHFTTPLTRRAAERMLANFDSAAEGLGDEDADLASLLNELHVRAAREPATPASLDAQRLQLELGVLRRRLQAARAAGGEGVTEIAQRMQRIKDQLDEAVERSSADHAV